MKNKKGFTLIELMIVIAIIAILAAILVPNFLKARAQGQLAACESNIKNLATALEMYATDNTGTYPNELVTLTSSAAGGGYMKTIPLCPSSRLATSYGYDVHTTPDNFTMNCTGANAHLSAGSTNGYPQYAPGQGLIVK
ncbi:MAG: prepilin-type N-terminal cleavage/methylation domain-containing protein [Candidatus Eremiobacterota bacterium]